MDAVVGISSTNSASGSPGPLKNMRRVVGQHAARPRRGPSRPDRRRGAPWRGSARWSRGVGVHVSATSSRWRRLAAFWELANVEIHRRSSAQPGMTKATWGRPSRPVVARKRPSPAVGHLGLQLGPGQRDDVAGGVVSVVMRPTVRDVADRICPRRRATSAATADDERGPHGPRPGPAVVPDRARPLERAGARRPARGHDADGAPRRRAPAPPRLPDRRHVGHRGRLPAAGRRRHAAAVPRRRRGDRGGDRAARRQRATRPRAWSTRRCGRWPSSTTCSRRPSPAPADAVRTTARTASLGQAPAGRPAGRGGARRVLPRRRRRALRATSDVTASRPSAGSSRTRSSPSAASGTSSPTTSTVPTGGCSASTASPARSSGPATARRGGRCRLATRWRSSARRSPTMPYEHTRDARRRRGARRRAGPVALAQPAPRRRAGSAAPAGSASVPPTWTSSPARSSTSSRAVPSPRSMHAPDVRRHLGRRRRGLGRRG